ncbi:MAG: hypothetical protein QOJ52_3481, partial [Acidimicrobiaceae bacterium]|nr:hypothetical protein [Acidimicrobiaceae bacterium]
MLVQRYGYLIETGYGGAGTNE